MFLSNWLIIQSYLWGYLRVKLIFYRKSAVAPRALTDRVMVSSATRTSPSNYKHIKITTYISRNLGRSIRWSSRD